MLLDYQKETTPVLYGGKAVKILDIKSASEGEMIIHTHWHERMELLLIYQGQLSVSFGDETFLASTGQLVIIPPAQPHSGIVCHADLGYYTIMFDPAFFMNSIPTVSRFLEYFQSRASVFERITSEQEIIATARRLVNEYYRSLPAGELLIAGETYRLMGLLYRFCFLQSRKPSDSDLRFKEIIAFIDENYQNDLSCRSLSRKFGYDEAYFSRKFKDITGLSPTVYIRILRLEYAQKLLKKGISVAEAARQSGFSDAGYFSRCFRKQYAMTPTEFIMN